MLRRGSASILLAVVLLSTPAFADEEPTPAPEPPAAEPTPTPEPPPAEPPAAEPPLDMTDPAWKLYHAAFSALAQGETELARSRLEDLIGRYPDHAAALRAVEALALLGGKAAAAHPIDTPPPDLRHEGKSKSARAELALVQTIHGIALGVELCLVLECDEATGFVGTVLLGAGAGVMASILGTSGGITDGQRATANSGTLWGAWNGAMLNAIKASDDSEGDASTAGLVLIGSQLAGLSIGVAAGQTLRPTEGQVSLANTVGVWTGVLTLFAHETFEIDFTSKQLLTTLLVTTDAAFLAGAYLAQRQPMSRGRTLVIDAGGVVGLFAGMGIVTLIQGEDADANLFFGSAMTGTVLGLATATWFTRRWDF